MVRGPVGHVLAQDASLHCNPKRKYCGCPISDADTVLSESIYRQLGLDALVVVFVVYGLGPSRVKLLNDLYDNERLEMLKMGNGSYGIYRLCEGIPIQ